ncbi:MAG: Dna2/Cas4 domain-containing protein [Anaerolineae bacterium]|jgi:CRISPR-associated exonuclease Cas4|nr:Dna2/Cas4 domain-containing protein [Anaerolineae bacterium]
MIWGGYALGFGFLLLAVALFLWWRSGVLAEQAGLPDGRILYSDTGSAWVTNTEPFYDPHLRLVGKPDYLVEEANGSIVPVEIKATRAPTEPYESHIYQLAAYCWLVEREYGIRPSHGIIQYKDRAFAVDYTDGLREDLLDLLTEMREDMYEPELDRDHNDWNRCARCGVASACTQRLG